jgi:hypothetical protein
MVLFLALVLGVGYALSAWSLWRQRHFQEPAVADRRVDATAAAPGARSAWRHGELARTIARTREPIHVVPNGKRSFGGDRAAVRVV